MAFMGFGEAESTHQTNFSMKFDWNVDDLAFYIIIRMCGRTDGGSVNIRDSSLGDGA